MRDREPPPRPCLESLPPELPSVDNLKRYANLYHTMLESRELHVCEACGRRFPDEASLVSHVREVGLAT